MSVPKDLEPLVRKMQEKQDLKFSQIFRKALDEYVLTNRGELGDEFYREWKRVRQLESW